MATTPSTDKKLTHDDIVELQNDLEELFQLCILSFKNSPVKTSKATSAVAEIDKKHKGLRTDIVKFTNTYVSLAEELNDENISFERASRELVKAAALLKAGQESYTKKLKLKESQDHQHHIDEETTQLLKRNAKVRTELQSGIIAKGVYLGVAPVLPMVNLNGETLRRAGVPCSSLSGYVVLEKQKVLGISRRYVNNQIEQMKEMGDKRLAKNLKKEPEVVNEVFDDLIQTWLAKHPGYTTVGTPCAWWEARWYWVIPTKELAFIRSAAYGGNFVLNKWDFAFQSSTRSK